MNEDVRIAAVRRDETEAAVFEVVSNNSCRHLSISCCLPCTAGCCERSTSGRPVPAEANPRDGHGFVGRENVPDEFEFISRLRKLTASALNFPNKVRFARRKPAFYQRAKCSRI